MPAVKLTEQQRAALAPDDRSRWLSAGAGCGKTFVLTERFLSYIDPQQRDPPAPLGKLAAITFTDAAAREMRKRIRTRCRERLAAAGNSHEGRYWQRLMREIDSARISTIHSFCAQLLRNHAVEARLDPQFETLDQAAADLLRAQTVDDELRTRLEDRDPKVLELAAWLGLTKLRNDLVRLLSDNPVAVIQRWRDRSPDEMIAVWHDHFRRIALPGELEALRCEPHYQELRRLADPTLAKPGAFRDHLQALEELVQQVDQFDPATAQGTPWSTLGDLARVRRKDGSTICKKSDWYDADCQSAYSGTCKLVRQSLDRSLLQKPMGGEDARHVARLGLSLLDVAADLFTACETRKAERNALQFDDLLERTHALLTDPEQVEVRRELARSTRLLMVDEFQDTDRLQSAIIQAFCGDQWRQQGLFVVGDFKQSIYRFRGADPDVSAQLRDELPEDMRLSLTANFRSQPAILRFVNALFHDQFEDTYEPLEATRPQVTAEPAVEMLWATPTTAERQEDRRITADEARRREARWIARRLQQMLQLGQPLVTDEASDPPQTRPVRAGDIAILLRSVSSVAVYEEALREHGLPYYLAGGHAFYAQQEIYDLLHLLRAIASPADELSLAGALRSPLFALTDETLFWLVEREGSLNAGLFAENLPLELTDREREKVVRAAEALRYLRAGKDQWLVAELVEKCLELTGYDAALLCEFLGERKLANVYKLVEQARTLDRTEPGDLWGFITQLGEFVVQAPKEALAATQAEGDVINIMTIHKAKGLEFPVVVLADMDRKLPVPSNHPVFDEQLGPLLPNRDGTSGVGFDLFRAADQAAEAEERTRLLYVACTRAADYLILSSSIEELEKPQQDWMKLIAGRFDLGSGSLVGSLPAGYQKPAVHATTVEPKQAAPAEASRQAVDLLQLVEKTRNQIRQASGGSGSTAPIATADPIAPDRGAQRRFSFSRLSGSLAHPASDGATDLASDEAREVYPNARPPAVDARQLGQLVHAVLERIVLDRPHEASEWCEFLAPQYCDDPAASNRVATEMIERLLASPRAADLVQAQTVRREVEFLLPWPRQTGTPCYLEGVIDCLYQDAQGVWRVLDYKSNLTSAGDVLAAAAPYEMQMYVYTLAAEQALGESLGESTLVFLRPGVEHQFQFDAEARERMHKQVDQAIAALR